jgi:hypothetical protein
MKVKIFFYTSGIIFVSHLPWMIMGNGLEKIAIFAIALLVGFGCGLLCIDKRIIKIIENPLITIVDNTAFAIILAYVALLVFTIVLRLCKILILFPFGFLCVILEILLLAGAAALGGWISLKRLKVRKDK